MKKGNQKPVVINSIFELHRILELPRPAHPLISIVQYDAKFDVEEVSKAFVLNFYMVCLKRNFIGKLRYGQHSYDFDGGALSFISPHQLISEPIESNSEYSGTFLLIHPDFLNGYPLAKQIKTYGFFSYSANEALSLSEEEEASIVAVLDNIKKEYSATIDSYTQDVIISHLELLFSYSNRFYNRQFITTKSLNHDLLTRFEALLVDHFNNEETLSKGIPTVNALADQLNISAGYLSDMLRALTGQNAQQHIHAKMIEKAKEILSTSNLTVAEVAYQLGFGHPQSFSKIFKRKTNISPIDFRNSNN